MQAVPMIKVTVSTHTQMLYEYHAFCSVRNHKAINFLCRQF